MGIEKANVTTRLNAQVDHRGVIAAIVELARRAGPDDRVIIYLNFHGGDLGGVDYDGYDIQDEVLASVHVHRARRLRPRHMPTALDDDEAPSQPHQ